MDLTVFFDFKAVCAPPPLPTTLHASKITIVYWNRGPKKCAGTGTHSTFCNKTLFQSIYVTLSIKMNVSPLYIIIL